MKVTYEFRDRDIDIDIDYGDLRDFLETIAYDDDLQELEDEIIDIEELGDRYYNQVKEHFRYLVDEMRDYYSAVMERH